MRAAAGAFRAFEIGRTDQRARILGLRETEKWAKAVHDAEPVRRAHSGQIIDIDHTEFHRTPLAVIDRIYSKFGLRLSAEVEADMAARIAQAPETRHGVHTYDMRISAFTEDFVFELASALHVDQFGLRPRRRAR